MYREAKIGPLRGGCGEGGNIEESKRKTFTDNHPRREIRPSRAIQQQPQKPNRSFSPPRNPARALYRPAIRQVSSLQGSPETIDHPTIHSPIGARMHVSAVHNAVVALVARNLA